MIPNGALGSRFDSFLLDLDGVVYVGPDAVPGAAETITAIHAAGRRAVYVTNNASRPPGEVAAQLVELGVEAAEADVITSAQAGAALVAQQIPAGSPVLAVGGPGVAAALRERGFVVIDALTDEPAATGDDVAAVVQGFGPDLTWQALARASFAVARGIPWIATNTDLTIPVAAGIAPGNGTLVNAVAAASGRVPEVAGKPFPPLLLQAAAVAEGLRPLVVGDRLDTDIEGAQNAAMTSLLVLSGVSGALDLWRAPSSRRPHHLARDLSGLLSPPLRVSVDGDSATAGEAVARLVGPLLQVDVNEDPVAAVWAAAHLVWQCAAEPDNAVDVAGDLDSAIRSPGTGR
ncbi:MAG: HAD-IIA family hydrolase [Candidatus Nanopelagicales bacterium]